MSTPFQNRLVGTIIVAAAIIIFLPDVLDGKKTSNQADFDKIPQAPVFTGEMIKKPFPEQKLVTKDDEITFNEQAQDALLETDKDIPKSKLSNNKKTGDVAEAKANKGKVDTTKVTPATKANKIVANTTKKPKSTLAITKPILGKQPPKAFNKEAWVIQLGSFKHKSNVAELVAKLKRNGYTVFTKPIKTKKGTLTKVCVGPELIKQALIKKLPALKKLTNVQGKIARFYPTN